MRHDRRDAAAAIERARRGHTPGWHPLLAAIEVSPGEWIMEAQYGRRYAIVRAIEIGGERGYRAVTWAESSDERRLIGYYRSLRAATAAAHRRFVDDHASRGGINGR